MVEVKFVDMAPKGIEWQGAPREPDARGPGGAAWLVRKNPGASPTGIATWFLHQPGVHMAWSWWMLGLCHLRDVPDFPPAKLHYPGAQYEITSFALSPNHPVPDPDQVDFGHGPGPQHLTPVDWVVQFHGVNDAEAAEILRLVVQQCVAGQLAADSDYRAAWKELIPNTAEHFRAGKCGPRSRS